MLPGLLEKKNTSEAMCCEHLAVDVVAAEVAECLLGKGATQLKAINAERNKRQGRKQQLCQEAV